MSPPKYSIHIRLVLVTLLAFAPLLSLCNYYTDTDTDTNTRSLNPDFYDESCPNATEIVKSIVADAIQQDARMAASLLRLHFHDCFVQGCDASLLLDNAKSSIISEKGAGPNKFSLRGFTVINRIKRALETACPNTVSCADILAMAARDSTFQAGGPYWSVPLGRRDSTNASINGSNTLLPAPNNTIDALISKFKFQGLNITDLVALSGSHTIGNAHCFTFKQRLYNQSVNGTFPDPTLDVNYARKLRAQCPRQGGDRNLFPMDLVSPTKFDNTYFKNLLTFKGLFGSDEALVTQSEDTLALVQQYAANNGLFFKQFSKSMIKMGSISVLTGSKGQIRKHCQRVK